MNRIKSVNRVFLATVFISLLGMYINGWVSGYTDNYFVILLISQILLVIPSVAYLIYNKINIAKAIRFNKIRISNVILIIVFSYLITPLMNFINALSMLYVVNDTADIMSNIIENNGLLLSLFMVALIPCILEETVYRGIFYNEYRKISPWKGILLSAFLFGVMHGNLNQFSYAFAMGITFALLIEATNSILATMIVHFFINGSSIIVLALYPKLLALLEALYGPEMFNAEELMDAVNGGVESMDLTYILQSYGIIAIIGTILAFIVYKTIAKNSGRWEHVKGIFRRTSSIEGPIRMTTNSSMDESLDLSIESPRDLSLDINNDNIPVKNKQRLLTLSLAIGILIGIALMISNEYYANQIQDEPLEEIVNSVVFHWNQWIK